MVSARHRCHLGDGTNNAPSKTPRPPRKYSRNEQGSWTPKPTTSTAPSGDVEEIKVADHHPRANRQGKVEATTRRSRTSSELPTGTATPSITNRLFSQEVPSEQRYDAHLRDPFPTNRDELSKHSRSPSPSTSATPQPDVRQRREDRQNRAGFPFTGRMLLQPLDPK